MDDITAPLKVKTKHLDEYRPPHVCRWDMSQTKKNQRWFLSFSATLMFVQMFNFFNRNLILQKGGFLS